MKNNPLFNATILLLFIILFFWSLSQAHTFIIPVIIATLLAMVLLPLCRRLEKKGIPTIPSILICLLVIISIIAGFVFLLYSQIITFSEDLPLFRQKSMEKLQDMQGMVADKMHISAKKQLEYLHSVSDRFLSSSGVFFKNFLLGITGGIVIIGLIIIYIFFFLLYRQKFRTFILKLCPIESHEKAIMIMSRIKELTQHYLVGLLLELAVLGTLNAIALLIIGVKQAIFFGYLAGLLNIIPYVGVLIGSLFPIIMALTFGDSFTDVIAVAAAMTLNQFIDNHFLTPKIVGSHVQVNPLATIMSIIIGGLVWGIPGMILFIPLLGIFKIICDHVDALKPIGFLLGEEEKSRSTGTFTAKIEGILKRKKK